jgi:hypothetical protein
MDVSLSKNTHQLIIDPTLRILIPQIHALIHN